MAALCVLLVDDDAWTEHVVSTVLGKRGHVLHVARRKEDALRMAKELAPDVLITEAALTASEDARDGAELVEALRRGHDPFETAVLVLTALLEQDERVRAIGADGYLRKPFRFVDLDHAVERTLRFHKRRLSAQQLGSEPAAFAPKASGIHGTLDQLSLASLLTMIEMERKSGILLLRRGSQSARLYCKDGRVLAARLFGAAPMTDVEVVYKLLTWTDGHFNFTATPVRVSDEIGLRTTHLLLEGARRSDAARMPDS